MNEMSAALVAQIVQLLAAAVPEVPSLVALGEQAYALLTSNVDPTDEQMAAIQKGLDDANTALQNA